MGFGGDTITKRLLLAILLVPTLLLISITGASATDVGTTGNDTVNNSTLQEANSTELNSTNTGNTSVSTQNTGDATTSKNFTVSEIKNAASDVRNYVETYNRLPSNVTINGTNVSISQFLELLTTALLQINSGSYNNILLKSFSNATNPIDNIKSGNILKAEYLKIASDIKNYMDSTGKSPDYAYGTSLGNYLGFQNLVYMYSMILDYYHTSGKIADWATMGPWPPISPWTGANTPVLATFTIEQIKDAASDVRTYIETNHKLPEFVSINGTNVGMSQFLELLTTTLLKINNGINSQVPLESFSNATNPIDNIKSGNILKAEYLKIASDIKNYMDSTGKAPDYAYGTNLGKCLGFQNLVYMYSMIIDYYHTSGKIADWAEMKPWSVVSPWTGANTPVLVTFTIEQIKDAASEIRNSIESSEPNHKLPEFVSINGTNVSMPQFLELLTTALLQINSGNNSNIPLKSFSVPSNIQDNIKSGNILKAEYLKLANDIKNYMDSTGKTPDYAYQTSLGTYLGFENLVYMYSMIIDYYHTSGKIADWAAMKPWVLSYPYTAGSLFSDPILDAIMRSGAGFGYSSAYHTGADLVRYGSGDCWAFSDYLNGKLQAAGYQSKIIQYATAYASNHRSVQVFLNGSWFTVPYRAYGYPYLIV